MDYAWRTELIDWICDLSDSYSRLAAFLSPNSLCAWPAYQSRRLNKVANRLLLVTTNAGLSDCENEARSIVLPYVERIRRVQ